ncbi:hypothetical protein D3C84_1247000 [compost metagenome]
MVCPTTSVYPKMVEVNKNSKFNSIAVKRFINPAKRAQAKLNSIKAEINTNSSTENPNVGK